MSKKNILPLLLIAVAAVAVFAFIVVKSIKQKGGETLQQQQGQTNLNNGKEVNTSEWKVYRNEEYGFEVKYPSGWIRKDHGLNTAVFPRNFQGTFQHPSVHINIKPNPEKKSIQEFYNGVKERNLFVQSEGKYDKGQIKQYSYFKFVPNITFAGEVIIIIQIDNAFIELADFGFAFQENGIFNTLFSTIEFQQ